MLRRFGVGKKYFTWFTRAPNAPATVRGDLALCLGSEGSGFLLSLRSIP